MFTLYRADSRPKDKIKDPKKPGFRAWVELSLGESQDLIRRVAINFQQPVAIPRGATEVNRLLADSNGRLIGITTLYELIRNVVSSTTIQVSTATSEVTGGRTADTKYKIELDFPLYQRKAQRSGLSPEVQTVNSVAELGQSRVDAYLITDTSTIDGASLIALYKESQRESESAPRNGEMAFLTPIPLTWITEYQVGGGTWQSM
ncbi:hypothetical protein [Nannocystis radixulma]|uniref:Uncharacterized protein n=1 Tax=Nannocystis radixulma TaxID=2995305 RepID=A0ABT5BK49_9BACT|nr:hypothetical protein [Nannocystis radixulma]MDC0674525.1 hypothetical protein [Nannocystis radixulma]